MNRLAMETLVDDQFEEIEFAGRTKESAERLAARQGFSSEPDCAGWVAPGIWLLRYSMPSVQHPSERMEQGDSHV